MADFKTLDEIIRKACAFNQEDRYESVAHLLDALTQLEVQQGKIKQLCSAGDLFYGRKQFEQAADLYKEASELGDEYSTTMLSRIAEEQVKTATTQKYNNSLYNKTISLLNSHPETPLSCEELKKILSNKNKLRNIPEALETQLDREIKSRCNKDYSVMQKIETRISDRLIANIQTDYVFLNESYIRNAIKILQKQMDLLEFYKFNETLDDNIDFLFENKQKSIDELRGILASKRLDRHEKRKQVFDTVGKIFESGYDVLRNKFSDAYACLKENAGGIAFLVIAGAVITFAAIEGINMYNTGSSFFKPKPATTITRTAAQKPNQAVKSPENLEKYRENQKRIVGVTYSVDWFDNEKISVKRENGSSETIWQRHVNWNTMVVKDSLSLSPDRSRIVYAEKEGNLFVMNGDGTLIHQLTSTKNAINSEPVWFDKNTVGFKTKSIDDILQYFWISLDAHNNIAKCSQYTPKEAAGNKTPAPFFWWSGSEENVAGFYLREKNGDAKLVQETKNYPDLGKNFAISPDGTRVLYINGVPELERKEGISTHYGGSQIRIVNIDGTNDKEITALVEMQNLTGENINYAKFRTVVDFEPFWIDNSTLGFKRKSMDHDHLYQGTTTGTKIYKLTIDKNNTGYSLRPYNP